MPPIRAVALRPGPESFNLALAGTWGVMFAWVFGTLMQEQNGDFSLAVQQAHTTAHQADGKVVVAGEVGGTIGLVRYMADGALDLSFGTGGRVQSDLAWAPWGVAVEANGRIVVFGTHRDSVALVGFRPDGSLDPTFGTAGRTLTDVDEYERASIVIVLPDGRLQLAGVSQSGSFLARYSPAGVIDPTFGDGGVIRNAFPRLAGWQPSMSSLRQPDGTVLLTSFSVVSRLLPDGRLDTGFGTDGRVGLYVEESRWIEDAMALAVQPDGRILVGGETRWGASVVRFHADGSRDPAWSINPTPYSPNGQPDYPRPNARRLFVEPDGRVLAVTDNMAVRYRTDGTLDRTFGTNGRVLFGETVSGSYGTYFAPGHTVEDLIDAYFVPNGMLISIGSGGQRGYALAVNRISEVGRFHALPPARILDTRTDGGINRPLGPAGGRQPQVTGRGGVPSRGVSAVVLNVTVTDVTAETFLSIWPTNSQAYNVNNKPVVSSVKAVPGRTAANLVTVALGHDGNLSMFNNAGSISVVMDVAGWYGDGTEAGGARFHPLSPARILDTRAAGSAVGPASAIDLQVTGRGGLPASGVSAVVMNLTAVDPTAGTFLTASPAGAPRPLASNLNVVAGQTAPNLVTVAVGPGGKVNLFNWAGRVHLVADVAGWYGDGSEAGGSRFHAVYRAGSWTHESRSTASRRQSSAPGRRGTCR